MLFRRHDTSGANHPERDHLMVVFVVGETPTGGVDTGALRNALDQIAWLRGWTGNCASPMMKLIADTRPPVTAELVAQYTEQLQCFESWSEGDMPAPPYLVESTGDDPYEIEIIGPTYSGSATSMQEVLQSWRHFGKLAHSPPLVSVLSGTATAITSWQPEPGVDFHSTQLPGAETLGRILFFFREELHEHQIAILSDDTSYGASYRDSNQKSAKAGFDGIGITQLPYPIHISNVRTISESFLAQQVSPATTPQGFEHRNPSVPDEGPGQDSYLAPSFSRITASVDEVALAKLLSTIHQRKVHYVGIVATNIQDAIFLIREIRDNCPDTIPFLTSADLLYLHSDFNRQLIGALIFSTYPLFASNQLWTWPSNWYPRQLQFPSGEAEGIYNAALAALSDSKLMVEYTFPFSSASEVPPLWVSVVGNDALWPVSIYLSQGNPSVFTRSRQPGSAEVLPRNFASSLYPQQINITFTLVILLCLLPNLYLMQRYRTTDIQAGGFSRALWRITLGPPRRLARLLDDIAGTNRADHRLSLLSFVLVLFTFFIVASAVWLLPLRAMSLWTPPSSSSVGPSA
jgi:hypothetical protein